MISYLSLSVLLLVFLGVGWWAAHARARESALRWALWGCKNKGYQLLDQAIFWRAVRLKRQAGRFRFHWFFDFDYYCDEGRYTGSVVVLGQSLEQIYFPTDPESHEDQQQKVVDLSQYAARNRRKQ